MAKEIESSSIDVDGLQIVEDVQDKVDLLISILEKKGVLGKGEFEKKYGELMDKIYSDE